MKNKLYELNCDKAVLEIYERFWWVIEEVASEPELEVTEEGYIKATWPKCSVEVRPSGTCVFCIEDEINICHWSMMGEILSVMADDPFE